MYQVEFTAKATKQFVKLPEAVRKTIRSKLTRLARDPYDAPEVKALKGIEGYRLRVSDYRVIYTLIDDRLIVLVTRVAHRKEVYQ